MNYTPRTATAAGRMGHPRRAGPRPGGRRAPGRAGAVGRVDAAKGCPNVSDVERDRPRPMALARGDVVVEPTGQDRVGTAIALPHGIRPLGHDKPAGNETAHLAAAAGGASPGVEARALHATAPEQRSRRERAAVIMGIEGEARWAVCGGAGVQIRNCSVDYNRQYSKFHVPSDDRRGTGVAAAENPLIDQPAGNGDRACHPRARRGRMRAAQRWRRWGGCRNSGGPLVLRIDDAGGIRCARASHPRARTSGAARVTVSDGATIDAGLARKRDAPQFTRVVRTGQRQDLLVAWWLAHGRALAA